MRSLSPTQLALAHAGAATLGVAVLAQVVLGPMRDRYAAVTREVAAMKRQIESERAAAADAPVPEGVQAVRRRIERIDALAGRLSNASALYERLGALAADAGVRVERLEPAAAPVSGGAARQTSAFEVESGTCSVSVTGDYAAVCRFLASIREGVAMSTVQSVRVVPRGGDSGQDVSASAEIVLHQLRRPMAQALAQAEVGGGAEGKQ